MSKVVLAFELTEKDLPAHHITSLKRDALRRSIPIKTLMAELIIEKSRAIKKASAAHQLK